MTWTRKTSISRSPTQHNSLKMDKLWVWTVYANTSVVNELTHSGSASSAFKQGAFSSSARHVGQPERAC